MVVGLAGGRLALVENPMYAVSVQEIPCLDATRQVAHVTFADAPCQPLDVSGAVPEATQAHGGIGYTWEYPLHVWLKRAVFDKVYMGAPSLHRQRSADMAGWPA